MPAASAAAITSSSRSDPPGWMIAVAPAPIAASTPSAKGKNASEATTEPKLGDRGSPAAFPASAALAAAILTLSTRLIWPAPMPTVARPRAKTIALDLTCFATLSANSRSAISVSLGLRRVTVRSSSGPMESRSRSCTSMPLDSERKLRPGAAVSGIPSVTSSRSDVLRARTVIASSSTCGAMTTSISNRPIASAVAGSRRWLRRVGASAARNLSKSDERWNGNRSRRHHASAGLHRSQNRFKEGSAHFEALVEHEPIACTLRALCAQPSAQVCAGTKERDGRTARCRCAPAVGEIVPYDGIDGSRIAQGLPALGSADFDPASAGSAGRFDIYVRTKHAGDAESVDCTDGVKLPVAKPYAVFCLSRGKWVSIKDDVCRLVASQEIMRL